MKDGNLLAGRIYNGFAFSIHPNEQNVKHTFQNCKKKLNMLIMETLNFQISFGPLKYYVGFSYCRSYQRVAGIPEPLKYCH